MKWYVIPSLLACGFNCTLGTVVLSLAVFHLYTDKSTNAPIPPNEEWISRMTGLIPFSVVWIVVSFFAIFVSLARNRIWAASTTMFLLLICFGVSVYFTCAFSTQLVMEDVSAESLVDITQKEIDKAVTKHWIPGWLDNIQKQSKQCCGIITYRDYEQFWSDSPTKLPHSCCRDEKLLPSPCPGDLTHIPYPHTPAIFYKVETGCIDDINGRTLLNIQETYQNCVIVSIFVGIGVLAFLLLFVKRYLVTNKTEMKVRVERAGCDKCRVKDDREGPLQVTSDAYPPLPPAIDSYDGGYQNNQGSMDSMTGSKTGVNKPAENPVPYNSTSAPAQKTNAVFAGLQTRQPEASTGDDTMTINAGNMGRHEIYVAQDIPLVDTPAGRVVLQSASSVDDVGDVVHEDGLNQSPPGSPGRKKKVRKVGVAHHHKKHHHHHTEQEQ